MFFSLEQAEQAAKGAGRWHHPNFRGVTRGGHSLPGFTFKPFTGAEVEPLLPAGAKADGTLTTAALELLREEYSTAHELWQQARYVRDLATAADGAHKVWDAYTKARAQMDEQFAALATTTDGMWRSAVSRLVKAQSTARAAAVAWDATAARIVAVHEEYRGTTLSHRDAYERGGSSAWVIGDLSDYRSSWSTPPLTGEVDGVIREQQRHVRAVSDLVGTTD
ncbi:hypothetical protein [Streptomyces sp. NPDC047315]|uniref:hypothetical protein n=1 Tax=Streptomyces sp. NPDC047315 TaxID=3155142 RepID=UPI003403F052